MVWVVVVLEIRPSHVTVAEVVAVIVAAAVIAVVSVGILLSAVRVRPSRLVCSGITVNTATNANTNSNTNTYFHTNTTSKHTALTQTLLLFILLS